MSDWQPFVYGGIASVVAEFSTFPIDTTKTRLQIQGQVIDVRNHQLKYKGFNHAVTTIVKEEGFVALYSGLGPALLRQATYGTIKLGVYHSLKKLIYKDETEEKLLTNVGCGIIAGMSSSMIANPTDVIKIRMQARGGAFTNPGIWESFFDIARQEGMRGLWRGMGPNASRAALVVGAEFPAYDFCKKSLHEAQLPFSNTFIHLLSSFSAGVLGALATNPVDVIKTRMMNQRRLRLSGGLDTAPAIYTNSIHCLIQTVRTEGVSALYKGLVPNWLRLGPFAIVFFLTYEQLKTIDIYWPAPWSQPEDIPIVRE
ncbi:hypothetical protein CAPTEDRAFT_178931 [Capitella teleta]|uniref:Uncharacterized protein n=1 Tax=Capitella teleta TaxID=283909 RepID=R7U8G2_CAPTE|nr:hypothetical protein CAPTEDRAFT_178931 [Capitella teleta]|eukprot:ELT99385.1 hypothetical protein CAPTEDRAFT_178931 [Capitella teleta]